MSAARCPNCRRPVGWESAECPRAISAHGVSNGCQYAELALLRAKLARVKALADEYAVMGGTVDCSHISRRTLAILEDSDASV